MKVYEAIAQSLIAEGLTDFFGLMGDGNMWLWGALCRNPSVKPYNARHEAMAVSMADGYARTTGKVGIAMVTCGPGLTQCGTSLIAAYRGKTPIVLIAGEIEAGAKNSMQSMDQRRFAEASSARFHTITSIDNMAEEIAEAFYAARLHRGPIVLNLPMDLQEEDFDWDYEYRPSMEFLPPRMETPSPDQLAPVIEKLIAAERPGHHRRPRRKGREREGRDRQAGRSRRRFARDVAARQGLLRRPSLGHRHRRCLCIGAVRTITGRRRFCIGCGRGTWLLHDGRRSAVPVSRGRAHRHQADARADRSHSRPVCAG